MTMKEHTGLSDYIEAQQKEIEALKVKLGICIAILARQQVKRYLGGDQNTD